MVKRRHIIITGAVVILAVAAVLVGRTLVQPARVDFTVTAQTGILRLHTYCAQRLVWDLPPGVVSQPEGMKPPTEPTKKVEPEPKHVSLALEGNVLITVSRSSAGNLLVNVQRGKVANRQPGESDASQPLGTVTEKDASADDEGTSQTITRRLYYTSADNSPAFTLPVWGRVIVGDDVPQGSGSVAGAAPLLREARVRARVGLESAFNQGVPRKTIIDESLDAGDVLDTHPDLGSDKNPCAAEDASWAAVGFISSSSKAAGANALDVVAHRNAHAVSVTRATAAPFELSVTRWHTIISNVWAQFIATLFVVILSISTLFDKYMTFEKVWQRFLSIGTKDKK